MIFRSSTISILVLVIFLTYFDSLSSQSANTLWYDRPAEHFEETLVLGNGRMGASVFGGIETDSIYLNDITLWSGEPVDPNMNPDAHTYIPTIREALKNENYALADSLQLKIQGSFSQSYMPLGTMKLHFEHEGSPSNYRRELSLENAISKISYSINGVEFTREYFVSHPDKVMVIRLKSAQKGKLSFQIDFNSLLKYEVAIDENILEASGYAPYHVEPNYRGDMPNAVRFDPERGTRFSALFHIKNTDGEVTVTDNSVGLENGTEALIFISIATSFNGYDKNPATQGLDHQSIAKNQLTGALDKSFVKLRALHLLDYQNFFQRVHLNLGQTSAPDLPTDARLKSYAKGEEDKNLEVLYFQYGRYLLISSSRTPKVPANLQGIWNPYLRPPWSSNYTTNINLQENYWLAENANLTEMHIPLLSFIENLSKTGAVTAKNFYNTDGWAACHNSDIWAMSNPVGDFGEGDPKWANWNMGGVWLSTHLWEHYEFTRYKEFLGKFGYRHLKGAAQFSLNMLVEDENGYLITSPSTSPEAAYITSDGYEGQTLYGATADLAMIRECFEQTIAASKIMGIDTDFRAQLEKALERLYPYQIGKKGNLQEWYHDWEDAYPKHRHQTHLYGLYPGHHITPEKTPELAEACRVSLEIKGDDTTGWSKGWRINLWARLWDGNRAYKMYRELLRYVEPDGVKTTYARGGGTYPNLFDAHPPFQIDGNFGGAAAVIEMLMQSTVDEIRLLPALPDAWPEGNIKGVMARGAFEMDLEWKDKKPVKIVVRSPKGGTTTLIHQNKRKTITVKPKEKVEINW
ncbi:glycoside hydrolase family 95 protein [Maribacter halichondriae]|uniref:glycoside hydrolase family 95 protein n=1 Tax=Maribacter halichondriae TaxID=2980554 RepID=UPI0023588D2C|nr:glycoside hydrolase family 95 protein [Maribacter sp. Hal144]